MDNRFHVNKKKRKLKERTLKVTVLLFQKVAMKVNLDSQEQLVEIRVRKTNKNVAISKLMKAVKKK
tara:strand:- start:623 stop:820 length:198 start_codon:yes stop_codon:yes gene_type:complete